MAQKRTVAQSTKGTKLRRIKGATGKEYLIDEHGRIIDPETGIIYDPNTGIVLDPQTGLSLDLSTGTVMSLDVAGVAPAQLTKTQPVGRVPLSDVYGIRIMNSVAPKVQNIEAVPRKPVTPVTSRLRRMAREFVRFMDSMAGVNAQYDLPQRLEWALEHLDEELEFIRTVVTALYDYSLRTTKPDERQFIRAYFPDATPAEREKILLLLKYLFDAKVVPPKGFVFFS